MIEEPEDIQADLEDEAAFEGSLASDSPALLAGAPAAAAHAGAAPKAAPPGVKGQPAWIGKVLGHFKLLRLVGRGAMGLVVQALDVNLQRMVALKILRKRVEGLEERQKVEQFFREARAAARIEHPNVIRVYEINQHGGWWYIAMEMLEGENLKKVVQAAGPLPPARACPIVADAATALAVAHELGIVHRDVKPSNLMITRNGRCKLTDFGFVRMQDPNDPFDFTDRSVGTPQFMAPEVIRQEPATAASDVYSLGATLYFALTGSPPYVGRSVADICNQHLHQPAPDLSQRLPACPPSLAALVRNAMAKDPAQRPTAGDFAAALHAEAVSHRMDDSGVLAASSVLAHPTGDERGSTMLVAPGQAGAFGAAAAPSGKRLSVAARWALAAACVAAVALACALLWSRFGGGHKPGRHEGLAGRFPGAPDTYGVRPPGQLPAREPLREPPAFSWFGKVNAAGARFVASREGQYYYRIDDPNALLIRPEHFVGYRTAEEARAAGKTPAP